jgi:hypothetical protein
MALRRIGYWCDVELEDGADRLTAKSVIGWMDGVEAKLGECGVYAANWCWRSIMQDEYARYKTRKLWCAAYTQNVIVPPGWDDNWYLWQYTSSGRLPGYGGNLDMNKLNPDWIGGNLANILLNIEPLAQRDPRWAGVQLGTSNKTIGSHGCVITDATMMLRHFGIDIDPAELNTWLKANGGYQNTNWFVWSVLKKYDPRISFAYRYEYAALDKIDAQLAAGRPVIVNVDMVPGTPVIDEHWVLVVGKVDGSYIINDPWYGTQFKFEDKYGAPSKGIYIVSTYNFTGTPAPLPPDEPEPLPVLEVGTQVKTLVNLNIRKGAGTGYSIWATAPKGTTLDVLEIKGDWVRVGWNQWCMSKYNGVRYLG